MSRLLWLGLALGACGAEATDDGPFVPTAPTSACRATSHDWAPMESMGDIVAFEPAAEFTLAKPVLELGMRQAGLGNFTPVPFGVRSWRVRYVTQDKGQVVEATAVVTLPDSAEPLDAPSVVWAHGTTGFMDDCAPSAGGVEGMAPALLMAAQGFAVVSPDYLGLSGFGDPSAELHPYLVAEPAAVATLDSVRALWNLDAAVGGGLTVRPTSELVLWGASEGGFTVLHADRLVTHYLPEANLVGTVAAVPPTDLQGLLVEAVREPSPATAGLIGGMVGMASWSGDLDVLSTVLQAPYDTSVYEALASTCDPGDVLGDVSSLDEVFTAEALAASRSGDVSSLPPFDCYLREGTLRLSPVPREHDAPVFFQISGADDLVVASVVRDDAPRLCDAGYRLDFLECEGAGHVDGAVMSLPAQLDWVKARLAGEPLDAVCDLDDVRDCSTFLEP